MIEYFKLWVSKELTEFLIGIAIVVNVIIILIIAQNKGRK